MRVQSNDGHGALVIMDAVHQLHHTHVAALLFTFLARFVL
jgi:hypothetical protein